MKKEILALLLITLSISLSAQTATNFTCNDCKGTSYDLFTELASGKVVVLCWVMPCATCVGPALTTYNVVQSYATTHPGKVVMYLCDDYANTPCPSLNSWANSYSMTEVTLFSNASIKMTDYGTPGMPKIIVIAPDHSVLYNANNSVNATALQNAINTALTTTSISQPGNEIPALSVYPNPIRNKSVITFQLETPSQVEIDLLSLEGAIMENVFSGYLNAGENRIETKFSSLKPGIYFIRLNDGANKELVKIAVTR